MDYGRYGKRKNTFNNLSSDLLRDITISEHEPIHFMELPKAIKREERRKTNDREEVNKLLGII